MIKDKTQHRGYPLPHAANNMGPATAGDNSPDSSDVGRIRAGFEAVDRDIQALKTFVPLAAGGTYQFPATMNAGDVFVLQPAGDLETNPATLDYNGHKLKGELVPDGDSFDMNVGLTFVYVSAEYGLGVR